MQILKLSILVMAFYAAACAGKGKTNPTAKAEDVAIPEELAKNYQITDYNPALLLMVPAQQPGKTPEELKGKKKKKMAKKDEPAVKEPAPATLSGGMVIPHRRPKFDPVWVGEKITMDVTWLKTRGGDFTLEVLPFAALNNRKVYHIRGIAQTSDFFSYIYRATDTVESFIDFEGWFPYKFTLNGDESKYIRRYLELFDHGASKQYIHTFNQKVKTGEISEEKGYKDLTPLSQDSISALYYARTLDMSPGSTLHFPMTTNGSVWETSLVIVGREEISTKMGKLKTIKTKVETRFRGNMQQKGDSFIWYTDDERKYPVKFEAKVKIGYVTGTVTKIEPGSQSAE